VYADAHHLMTPAMGLLGPPLSRPLPRFHKRFSCRRRGVLCNLVGRWASLSLRLSVCKSVCKSVRLSVCLSLCQRTIFMCKFLVCIFVSGVHIWRTFVSGLSGTCTWVQRPTENSVFLTAMEQESYRIPQQNKIIANGWVWSHSGGGGHMG